MARVGAVMYPSDDGQVQVQPLQLGEAGIEPGPASVRLQGPRKRRRGLVALDNNWLWAVTRDIHTNRPVVARFDLGEASRKPAAVAPLATKPEKFPATLAVHDQTCFVGWNAEVHAIRFEPEGSRTVVLHSAGCPGWKPFDIICGTPPLLLAIDDVVTPKWRMCIDMSTPESPTVVWTHEFEEEEAYAEYRGATACGSRIVLLSTYGNTYGTGHVLELVAVGSGGIRHFAEMTLRMGPRALDGDRMAVLEEKRFAANAITAATGEPFWGDGDPLAVLHRPTQSATTVDHMPFSRWTGIAASGDQVFVAAGPQGLLRFRVEDRGLKMLPRAIIGDCLDVVSSGKDIAVLVRGEQSRRVLQLRPDASGSLHGIGEAEVHEAVHYLVGQSG